jgi:hypothetical protein
VKFEMLPDASMLISGDRNDFVNLTRSLVEAIDHGDAEASILGADGVTSVRFLMAEEQAP